MSASTCTEDTTDRGGRGSVSVHPEFVVSVAKVPRPGRTRLEPFAQLAGPAVAGNSATVDSSQPVSVRFQVSGNCTVATDIDSLST